MSQRLLIERKDEKGLTRISLKGTIDETANLKEVFQNLQPRVIVQAEEIRLINSCGVREWVRAIQRIPSNIRILFERCASRIVEQINYVSNFLGSGEVVSFFAPYFCPSCREERSILLSRQDLMKKKPVKAPLQKCPACREALEFDDVEEEYFSFLNRS